ncbi:MAG: hypothetical protein PF636_03860 [Actinomycetota bacterium]|jgi:hypothetical protein|nr:hypothetical protein [Actinomycetota bacterium]
MLRSVRTIVCAALLVGVLMLSGCAESDDPEVAQLELQGWDSTALKDLPESILAIRRPDDMSDSLCLAGLDGSITDLWSAPSEYAVTLLDCDPVAQRVLLRLSEMGQDAFEKVTDHLVVLDENGEAVVLPHRSPEYPYVSDGLFSPEGEVLSVEMLESMESIETTLSRTTLDGGVSRVELSGDAPEHHYVWSLDKGIGGEWVNVVFKTQGTPATNDDFASVICEPRGDELVVRGAAYSDDSLFTRSVVDDDTFVFVRNSVLADELSVDLVEVVTAGGEWAERVLAMNAAIDPGFEHDSVCGPGPEGTVLVRMATLDQEAGAGALARVDRESGALELTEIRLAEEFIDQWMWLGVGGV